MVECELGRYKPRGSPRETRKKDNGVTKYSQCATLCNTFLEVKGRYGGGLMGQLAPRMGDALGSSP